MNDSRKVLFDYWNSIPTLKFINAPEKIYKSQPIRRAIVQILREGLEEPIENEKKLKRNALSATELKKLLLERKDIKISQTNLYFHLNVLKDAGFIQVGAILLEGPDHRIKTNYYGRVARNLFITDQELSLEASKQQFMEFEKLAKKINLPLPKDFISLPRKYHDLMNERYKLLANWLVKQEPILEEGQINISDVFEFLKILDRLNPEFSQILGDLASVFQDYLAI